jgi:Glutathione S-transferase, N-terminal domain
MQAGTPSPTARVARSAGDFLRLLASTCTRSGVAWWLVPSNALLADAAPASHAAKASQLSDLQHGTYRTRLTDMQLYVCWGMFSPPAGHSCRRAYEALKEAGYEPEVIKSYGSASLPVTEERSEKHREGADSHKTAIPALVTDEGEVISESHNIVAWAERNPAPQLR